MNNHYQFYDQGLFQDLSQKNSETISQFVDSANSVLHINFYEHSFIIVPRPSSFLEAIGLANFYKFSHLSMVLQNK